MYFIPYFKYIQRCQRPAFPPPPLPPAPPAAPLPVAPCSESRLPDPSHTIRLPAPAPGSTTHAQRPKAGARSLPAEKHPQAPARQAVRSLAPRAERPQPCPRPHSASSVAAAAPLTLPHAGPEAAGRKQSGRESQPQASDTPCSHSALRASRPPSVGMPRTPGPLIRYLT